MVPVIREAALNGLGVSLYRQDNVHASLIYLCTSRTKAKTERESNKPPGDKAGGEQAHAGAVRRENCQVVRGRAQRAVDLRQREAHRVESNRLVNY